MAINIEKTNRFLNSVERTFSPSLKLRPASNISPVNYTTCPDAASLRRREISFLLFDEEIKRGDTLPHAFLSEWSTYTAIAPRITEKGFRVDMAPKELEQGSPGRKGIDLVISRTLYENVAEPLIGINVKLSNKGSDRHYYDSALQTVAMNLNLGRWQPPDLLHSQRIRGWMNQYAVPSINEGSGQIPYIYDLRDYAYARIERTLLTYLDKAYDYENGKSIKLSESLFPRNMNEYDHLMIKLETAYTLFENLSKEAQDRKNLYNT